MSPKTRKLSHVYSVDGLRALALIAVVVFHMWPSAAPGGYFGVIIFFVIAGFFVSRNFVLEQSDGRYPSLLRYYRKRFIRLYMPLLAMVVIVNLLSALIASDIYAYGIRETPSVLLGFNNIHQALSGASYFESHGVFKPFTHLWALSLELQFYFIYPFVIRFLAVLFKNNVSKVSFVLWLVSILSGIYMALRFEPGSDPTPVYYSSLCRIFSFTIGGAFAFSNILKLEKISLAKVGGGDFNGPQGQISSLANRGFYKIGPTPFQSMLALLILIALIVPFFTVPYTSSVPFRGGMFFYSILVGLFIVLVYHDDVFLTPLLAMPLFRFLSQRSYSYYIWQYPIMMIFASKLSYSTFPSSLSNLIQLGLLLIVGEFSYRLLERGPKQRPYLKTPELAAGITPLLGFATALMFIVALVLPANPPQNDSELIKQKIAEARKEEERLKQSREAAQNQAAGLSQGETALPGVAGQGVQTPENTTAQNQAAQPGSTATTPGTQQGAPNSGAGAVSSNQGADTGASNSGAGVSVQATLGNLDLSSADIDKLSRLKVSVIGDSVTDMARADLSKYLPQAEIDAKISRQMKAGLELIKEKEAAGVLADNVIVALGANGDFNSSVLDEILAAVKGRKLYLMTAVCPDPHEQTVNTKLKNFAAAHEKDGVYLVDWYAAAKKKRDYFYRDATHPRPKGAEVYDALLLEALLKHA